MLAAKVFREHKRVVKPGEVDKTYSLDDFCTMEVEVLEDLQFYILNSSESFDLNDAFYFEIRRKTLTTSNLTKQIL